MTNKPDNPVVFVFPLSLDDVVWTILRVVWEVELSAQVSQGVIVAIKKMEECIHGVTVLVSPVTVNWVLGKAYFAHTPKITPMSSSLSFGFLHKPYNK